MPLIRHGIFLGLGFLLVIGFQKLHYKWFRKYALPVAILSLILLILSSIIGVKINGAQRAIILLGMTIQPAEIVKLTVVVLLATILARNQMSGGVTTKGVIYAATVVMIFGGCLWKNGLTNTILLMGCSVCMFLISGIQWRKLIIVGLVYAIGGSMLYMLRDENNAEDRAETHESRIEKFVKGVSPEDKITDDNRQVMLAKFSQAHGGLLGQGPGNSRESARLPLAFSDYIFSIIIEDIGFVGGVFLLILYLCLVARAGRVASKCTRAFPALLIMGCAVIIVFQALVHMVIVTGLSPVSGQPLPFISKGGTSILVMSAAIGMMLSVSRFASSTNSNKKTIKAELKELPEDIQTENPLQIQNSEYK
jgi:cell division protein FtsW